MSSNLCHYHKGDEVYVFKDMERVEKGTVIGIVSIDCKDKIIERYNIEIKKEDKKISICAHFSELYSDYDTAEKRLNEFLEEKKNRPKYRINDKVFVIKDYHFMKKGGIAGHIPKIKEYCVEEIEVYDDFSVTYCCRDEKNSAEYISEGDIFPLKENAFDYFIEYFCKINSLEKNELEDIVRRMTE